MGVHHPYVHASRELGVHDDRTFMKPAEISVWSRPDWGNGRRPPTVPLLHNVMPVHGPGNIWRMKVEINNDCWEWYGPPDEISGPIQLTVKVPDLRPPRETAYEIRLNSFLDQEIGL